MEYHIGFHSNGRLQALPANIRLGWKWIVVENTLAYCNTDNKGSRYRTLFYRPCQNCSDKHTSLPRLLLHHKSLTNISFVNFGLNLLGLFCKSGFGIFVLIIPLLMLIDAVEVDQQESAIWWVSKFCDGSKLIMTERFFINFWIFDQIKFWNAFFCLKIRDDGRGINSRKKNKLSRF